ncbi:hypothetical protein [Actinotalea sp. K2]|uniref:hypothetical protein n=1 Tax=Actinotalea sp. K2 TaxID=2939438 RepID=UPI00201832E7|nr:hypothetical protein [Actinotalea sp. K2]MCL3860367.1 hypothetical protein [Actinotalea sp. K2]
MVVDQDVTPHSGDDTTAGPTPAGTSDEQPSQEPDPTAPEASSDVMALLAEHVPLALLADLVAPDGPSSPEILQDEGLPEVAWWDGDEEPEAPTATE